MKAITIHQPWATLIALGEKKFETRGWPTKYRGPIAIHAGKHFNKEAWIEPNIYDAIRKHGLLLPEDFPTGAVIATAILTDCYSVHYDVLGGVVNLHGTERNICWGYPWINEYHFGDYSTGRYAWELTDIKQLSQPIAAKGLQGLWNWEPE